MQRQSLGSPGSKLHSYGGDDILVAEDPKRRSVDDTDERGKTAKPRRLSLSPSSSSPPPLQSPLPSRPEKFIHFIPVLTLICFLVLYLSSHNPSESDLAHFGGLKQSSKQIDSNEIGNIDGFEFQRGDILPTRSLRNLHELEKPPSKSRSHRKIADF